MLKNYGLIEVNSENQNDSDEVFKELVGNQQSGMRNHYQHANYVILDTHIMIPLTIP